MTGKVLKFPTIKEDEFIKESVMEYLEEFKSIDIGILFVQSGDDITIYCSRYSIDLIGALEMIKNRILEELMHNEEEL